MHHSSTNSALVRELERALELARGTNSRADDDLASAKAWIREYVGARRDRGMCICRERIYELAHNLASVPETRK
jgi:hypothetical protein